MPAFDETGWSRYFPVAVDNSAGTAALSYYQVAITLSGARYAEWAAYGLPSGADLRVVDEDGTTLDHWLEGIDAAASAVYLLAKVPRVAAGTTRNLRAYFGNPSASSISNAAPTIGPSSALTGPADIWTQSNLAGYNAFSRLILLRHQAGANASHNGDILAFFDNGSGHAVNDKSILMLRSTDGGVTFSGGVILAPVAGSTAEVLAVGEDTSGNILMCYGYDTAANRAVAKGRHYVAKSTNAGVSWTNLSTSPTNRVSTPWNPGVEVGLIYDYIYQDPAGNYLLSGYGLVGGDTSYNTYLMKCPAASDPTNGSNWTTLATVFSDPTIAFAECSFLLNATGTAWIAVTRTTSSPFDFYQATSTDATASTWGTPVRLGFQNLADQYQPVSPQLMRLANGNAILSYTMRTWNDPSAVWGSAHALSTDDGANWFDRPPYCSMPHVAAGTPVNNYGYPGVVQRPDGALVAIQYRSVGTDACNIERVIMTEDHIANGNNVYINCEAFDANWKTHQANVTISAAHVHNGTNAVMIDNSAGTGVVGEVNAWPPSNMGNVAFRVAHSAWVYVSQVASPQAVTPGSARDSTPTYRFNRAIFNDTHLKWFNGTAYQDTGVSVSLNAWHKLTSVYATTPSSAAGSLFVDNALATGSAGQYAAGKCPTTLAFQAGTTIGVNDVTMWVDDIYTHQYTSHIPAVAVGAARTLANRRRRLLVGAA